MALPNRGFNLTERELAIVSHDQLGTTRLVCSFVVRTATTADVLAVGILSPHLRWSHSTAQEPTAVGQ